MPEAPKVDLAEELERDRPDLKQQRPTGRLTRTGTQEPRRVSGPDRDRRVAKWRDREHGPNST